MSRLRIAFALPILAAVALVAGTSGPTADHRYSHDLSSAFAEANAAIKAGQTCDMTVGNVITVSCY